MQESPALIHGFLASILKRFPRSPGLGVIKDRVRLSDGARAVPRSQRMDSERRMKGSMRVEVAERCGRGPSALRDKRCTASPVFNLMPFGNPRTAGRQY